MQARFDIGLFTIHFDFKILPNSHALDFRHSEVLHGVTHRSPLRIEHRSLRRDQNPHFHHHNIDARGLPTSLIIPAVHLIPNEFNSSHIRREHVIPSEAEGSRGIIGGHQRDKKTRAFVRRDPLDTKASGAK